MAKEATDWQTLANFGIILVAIALVVTVAAGWLAISNPVSAIDNEQYKNLNNGLESYAQESLILSNEYKDHRATSNYVEQSAVNLHKAVSDLSDQLQEQPVKSTVSGQVNQLEDQATELEDNLSDLSRLPNDQKAAQINQQIRQIVQKVQDLS